MGLLGHLGRYLDHDRDRMRIEADRMVDEHNATVHSLHPKDQEEYQRSVVAARDSIVWKMMEG